MNIKTFKKKFTQELSKLYPSTEIDSFLFLLLEHILNFEKVDIVLKANQEISSTHQQFLNTALNRLKNEEPIQYIIGETSFYGLPFYVNKHTLIPRPETEELVDWVVNEAKSVKDNIQILDIGTGSGCIPISIAKTLTNATISSIDISEEALNVAKKNALHNKVAIHFYQVDILEQHALTPFFKKNELSVIVSNPPYVRMIEKNDMSANVLQNEPHLALFVSDENPLIFYDKIATEASKYLTKGGLLFLEINQYLAKETSDLLAYKGFKDIQIKKDIFGNDRMIMASNSS